MADLLNIVDEARKRLDEAGRNIVRHASEIPSYDDFAQHIVTFLREALYSPSIVKEWLQQDLGWIYSGIHINAQFFSLYGQKPDHSGLMESGRLSVVFDPRDPRDVARDKTSVSEYFAAGNNFTTFLWPADEAMQQQMRRPLEIIFSQSPDEDIQPAGFSSGFFIPEHVKSFLWQQESLDFEQFVSCKHRHYVLTLLRKHLSEKYHLPAGSEPDIVSCFAFLSNTANLHIRNDLSPHPRTVIFFPVNMFGERQGVFCFVFCGQRGQKDLTEGDRIALHLISDYAILSLRRVDQEISLVKKRFWLLNQRAAHALGLIHDANKITMNATIKAEGLSADLDTVFHPIFARHFAEKQQIKSVLMEIQDQLARMLNKFHTFAQHVIKADETPSNVEVGQIVRMSIENIRYNYIDCLNDIIRIDYSGSKAKVEAYPTSLSIAISTIISNAIEASQTFPQGKAKCVDITFQDSKQGSSYIDIVVQDYGVGLSSENLTHLKARMHNLEEARPIAGENAGYGLSVAYHIVCFNHHGEIDVASEYGKGSTFTIILKRTPEEGLPL